jgi:DNA modification methylase
VPIIFKIGVETFDEEFRQKVLNKHADFKDPEEVAAYFDSPCLMVGIQGQTREMIARDIEILKNYFRLGTVNVYNNNTTAIRRDEELVRWFMETYRWLLDDPSVEVLYEITDFGVG